MKRIALIPAYEPANRIISLVKELTDNNFKVIVVNDGSKKKYDKIFDEVKDMAHIINYKENKGKGYALKKGYSYIKDNYNQYIVVTLDSDNQHTVKDAIKLCDYAEEHKDTLVIGKRIRNEKTPFRSKIGNAITKMVYTVATGTYIYDTQTGLRAFTNILMPFCLSIPGNRYEYEMNVLLRASKEQIPIKEIEIETIYYNNNANSHFNTLKDSFRIYKEIIKFSLSSIISFIVDYISYIIFNIILKNVILSNIIARIISSTTNYLINKNIVFKSKNNTFKTALKYFSLVIGILLLNTLILSFLTSLNINIYLAKLITELLLFFISWLVQKNEIFN